MILKPNENGLDFAYLRVSTVGQELDRQNYILDNLHIQIPEDRRILEVASGTFSIHYNKVLLNIKKKLNYGIF